MNRDLIIRQINHADERILSAINDLWRLYDFRKDAIDLVQKHVYALMYEWQYTTARHICEDVIHLNMCITADSGDNMRDDATEHGSDEE